MATKDKFLLLKDKSFVNDTTDNQYSNLNLNQNRKSSILSYVQTCNKSSKVQNYTDATVSDSCEEKERLQLWNKSSKIKDSVILSDEAERDDKKSSKTANMNTTKNSTLSLHIAAYENEDAFNSFNGKNNNEDLQNEKSGKQQEIAKQDFTAPTILIQNSFEFPRQQNDEVPKPEISQFRASQTLLNLDEMSFSTQQEAMEACAFQFDAMSQKLLTQELRMKEKALGDLKKDYEQLKIREQTLMEKTRWEQGRTKAQEDKVKSLNEEIEKLKEDYECVIMERDNLKKEISALRRKSTDNTFRLQYESEIISYRTKIAGLESRLSRRQVEFDKSEEHMRHEIEKLQNLLNNTQIRLESSSASYSEKENLDSSSVEKLNDLHFKIGDLTATNKALRDEINRHVSEKSELQEVI
uniref:Uncharacterized protein n=1 Tax=Panagrolaimus sp. PS1159 TaxID=55785 RepID=A0AC35FMT7_9BILA